MFPKFATQILLKNTTDWLSNDMILLFFGWVVARNLITTDCVSDLKFRRNSIELMRKLHISWFSIDLNLSTSKIQIFLGKHPKFLINILLKSISNWLSNDIFLIFFGSMVAKKSIIENCVPNFKSTLYSMKFCKNRIFHDFLLIWIHQLQKFKYLQVCLQIFRQKFYWRVLTKAYRMTYVS